MDFYFCFFDVVVLCIGEVVLLVGFIVNDFEVGYDFWFVLYCLFVGVDYYNW